MKPVRRSQLISPWGIGSMIDFPQDESLMVCGLDAWHFANEGSPAEFKIIEERLQSRLKVDHFRLPPDFRLPAPSIQHSLVRIPCVRFPLWHFCPFCGIMVELSLFSGPQRCHGPNFAEGRSCHAKPQRNRPRLVPLRFIVACELGHISDFPWMEWVHRDRSPVSSCELRFRAGRSASLAGIRVSCTCGNTQSLAGSFDPSALSRINVTCGGQRPWLGDNRSDSTRCGLQLQVLQRGASNVYFAHIVSSIYLPLWGEQADRSIVETLEDPTIWSIISQGTVDGKVDSDRCEIVARMRGLDLKRLKETAQKKMDGTSGTTEASQESEEEYRQAEYEALRTARGAEHVDLFSTAVAADTYQQPINSKLESITLVHKLRETRAFAGFSRLLPSDARSQEQRIAELRLDSGINWLPAITVRGEGIFLTLNQEELNRWAARSSVQARAKQLVDRFNNARILRGRHPIPIKPKFILLHTFAHLLINQLSFDCGYGSSSLRERLYCDAAYDTYSMEGLLIYTASGDSEGTMGGLVRQGGPSRLENTTIRALRTAAWCSSDPICVESLGQGPDSCNLAACHSCALLPETSCEEGNRLLDRALVIGRPLEPDLGFFSDYMEVV
jgi:hypothetical protein